MARHGDQYIVRRPIGELKVPADKALTVCASLEEAYNFLRGRANLQDGYARISDGEVWLYGMHISPYEFSRAELDPVRPRKLLLHHRQIDELARALETKGTTLVPLRVYFKDGRAKVEIATARGKARYDKRQAIAKRDALRETQRALKGDRE